MEMQYVQIVYARNIYHSNSSNMQKNNFSVGWWLTKYQNIVAKFIYLCTANLGGIGDRGGGNQLLQTT